MTNTTPNDASSIPMTLKLKRVALILVFLWFAIGGVAHFALTEAEVRIVPPFIPWPRAAVFVSGAFELLGALGVLIPGTRRAAGVGLFLLTIAVTPANIYMLQHAEAFSVPYWALILRLPFQAVLLAMILWSTWNTQAKRNAASTASLL